MAKRIRVSEDDSTYYTLPGNTAELRNEAGQLSDTIFGQSFSSSETGLITGSLSANALYKGFAGYIVSLKKTGTPTGMVAQATTNLSGKIYRITDATKRILDTEAAITVLDNAVNHTADVIRIDYLDGTVEFDAGYTVTGPVTITANYLPTSEIAGAKAFTLTQTADAIDNTDIPTARANGGFATFEPGLKTASLEISGVYKESNAFVTALIARDPLVVEINPDNNSKSVMRGIFKYSAQGQSGDVGALEEETITLQLNVPDDDLFDAPLKWYHANDTTLSQAVRICLDAWIEENTIYVQYLPDGEEGFAMQAVVTDISLAGGLESMNEFTANFQLSGEPVAFP